MPEKGRKHAVNGFYFFFFLQKPNDIPFQSSLVVGLNIRLLSVFVHISWITCENTVRLRNGNRCDIPLVMIVFVVVVVFSQPNAKVIKNKCFADGFSHYV